MTRKRRSAAREVAPEPESKSQQRLEWLLEFLQLDVAALRVGGLLDTSADVVAFLVDPRMEFPAENRDADTIGFYRDVLGSGRSDERKARPARDQLPEPAGTEHISEDDVFVLQRPLLQELQARLLQGMHTLADGGEWWPFGAAVAPPQAVIRRLEDGTLCRSHVAGPLLPILLAAAIDLLLQWWPKIRRCRLASCGRFFLPKDGHQVFHDPKCSATARWSRYSPKRDHQKELIRRVELESQREQARGGEK